MENPTNSHPPADTGVPPPATGSVGLVPEPPDMLNDPEYQAFVESMVKHCHCAERHRPCDGVLAGGICDDNHDPMPGDYDDEGDEWHTSMSL